MRSERKKLKLLGMVMKTHFVFFLIFFPLILPISAYGNLAKNTSMEGSFLPQSSFGDVAENWTGWYRCKDRKYSEFTKCGLMIASEAGLSWPRRRR